MEIRPDIALDAVLKSLRDVVLPALDPTDKLAAEQSQLIVALLSLIADRLPLQFEYDLDELARSVRLARALPSGADLDAATERAEHIIAHVVPPSAISAAGSELKAAIGASITVAYAGSDDPTRASIAAVVLEAGDAQHLRERAWVIAQGWETDPGQIPPIEELLAR